jgi:hypothetical protein
MSVFTNRNGIMYYVVHGLVFFSRQAALAECQE